MNPAIRELAMLDRTVHAPPRLAILTVLLHCQQADFTFLLTTTGLTKGNLASNLDTLQKAGHITSSKENEGPRTRTNYELTGDGQNAIEAHWDNLERLKQQALTTTTPVRTGAA